MVLNEEQTKFYLAEIIVAIESLHSKLFLFHIFNKALLYRTECNIQRFKTWKYFDRQWRAC